MRHSSKIAEIPRLSEIPSNLSNSSSSFAGFEPYVDERAVARFLQLTPRRVVQLARTAELPAHPIGGQRKTWRFRISEIADSLCKSDIRQRGTMTTAVPGAREKHLG
jgi:hypothetical protein